MVLKLDNMVIRVLLGGNQLNINNRISNVLTYIAYGDSIGFLHENLQQSTNALEPFYYSYNNEIKIEAERGQWSYITQLTIINCKCLLDHGEKNKVTIDYKRIFEEIKLWSYYRCGTPSNYMAKLELGKSYYTDEFYWNDKFGEGLARIIPIALVNKNFNAAQEEVYKNVVYINRHPQVILSGLLLLRTTNFLLNHKVFDKNQLLDELKNYLMQLQLAELEKNMNGALPSSYRIKFEQEKINYLMDLDRVKSLTMVPTNADGKTVFLSSLLCFFQLWDKTENEGSSLELKGKEVYAVAYGLLALTDKKQDLDVESIKDYSFIKSMGEYLVKLREYEVEKIPFIKENENIDIFSLNKGEAAKHPLLNHIRIHKKTQNNHYVELIVGSKSGLYKFIKNKK
ncbi:hypothetical protein Clos_1834 [Alkaliphilus oremlandii OhILAs]|uniref:ADP-ribosylation/Crystallin J1 n=1 Tax=Alkaliphilus oremlandii (strain OhILAs) TaxID=350688 RepID=A8MHU2_ALKOO|nr:hypothetical protein Clos_1834 [Alkaliphilus oremlandii OhILAs]